MFFKINFINIFVIIGLLSIDWLNICLFSILIFVIIVNIVVCINILNFYFNLV